MRRVSGRLTPSPRWERVRLRAGRLGRCLNSFASLYWTTVGVRLRGWVGGRRRETAGVKIGSPSRRGRLPADAEHLGEETRDATHPEEER